MMATKNEPRTESEIMDQIRRCNSRLAALSHLPNSKANSEENRNLITRLKELNQEHYSFYGDW